MGNEEDGTSKDGFDDKDTKAGYVATAGALSWLDRLARLLDMVAESGGSAQPK